MNEPLYEVGDCLVTAIELWKVRKARGFADGPSLFFIFQDQAWLEARAEE